VKLRLLQKFYRKLFRSETHNIHCESVEEDCCECAEDDHCESDEDDRCESAEKEFATKLGFWGKHIWFQMKRG